MPHFQIEYSANLEEALDMTALCEALRAEAAQIETFPTAGIRVRAVRVDHVAMADGNPAHGFIDLSIRLRAGRSQAAKKDAIARVFSVLCDFARTAMESRPIALSAEMRDIDAELSPKFGNIRDHMEDKA
ncbi:5-carboxymethyl-2-hydroxymuconate isomerase [Phaeobacter sp. HS012]|uniref:5-carboxymethyl-2-hydroxymuconate Delta-isomerase n=1 Tax=unclassified Phaeobacter TaxID=2621772 RepID=UPI001B35939E|nr:MULTISPECIES: 5-carboxymethyl-2-hydroxymuconate Delta-isomerase [unclassified Phaeobacter]MBQ4809013.1 5-carboxymethyl-2-hydroxymuconate isomerase [Phaeobacter sp. HS012]MBQ4883863.1 5-carboxymethyl-2-hydroxymuconate isomerase [Phaeobacter sp. HS011]